MQCYRAAPDHGELPFRRNLTSCAAMVAGRWWCRWVMYLSNA